MVRPDDPIWKYAEKLKLDNSTIKKFKCTYCGRVFPGGASKAKWHLTKDTRGQIRGCNEAPEHVIREIKQAIGDHEEKNKLKQIKKNSKKLETGTQVKRSGNTSHANQGDEFSVNAKLAKFLLLNNIPFDVVETPSFKEFVESAVEVGTDYELPSVSMLRRREREAIAQYTKDIEECLVETGCTLIANTVDVTAMVIYLWTPKGLLFMAKFQYEEEHGDIDDFFVDKLSSTVKSLGPTHIVQFTCDDLYLFDRTRKEVCSQCHMSESIVNCDFNMITNVIYDISYLNVINCASMIFLYINNNSSINLTLGKEHERGKESDVSSSKFVVRKEEEMSLKELPNLVIILSRLKSLLADQDAVISQMSEQSSEAKYARLVCVAVHCEEFWSRAKKIVKFLEPLLEALCLVACQGGTIGYLSQSIHRAVDLVEEDKRVEDEYDIILDEELDEEWYRIRPIREAATILDPAYMLEKNLEGKYIYDIWCHYFDDLVKDSDKERLWHEFGAYCYKNSNIFTPSARDKLRTLHPGKWWELFGHSVPVLQKYALWIVMQPCTSYFFTDDELKSIIEDETEGLYRSRKLMMDRSSQIKATRLDDILIEAYEFAPRKGTNLLGYKSFVDHISRIDEDFWNASRVPNFQLLDNWPLPNFQKH